MKHSQHRPSIHPLPDGTAVLAARAGPAEVEGILTDRERFLNQSLTSHIAGWSAGPDTMRSH